jgi:hypothetical protein
VSIWSWVRREFLADSEKRRVDLSDFFQFSDLFHLVLEQLHARLLEHVVVARVILEPLLFKVNDAKEETC